MPKAHKYHLSQITVLQVFNLHSFFLFFFPDWEEYCQMPTCSCVVGTKEAPTNYYVEIKKLYCIEGASILQLLAVTTGASQISNTFSKRPYDLFF